MKTSIELTELILTRAESIARLFYLFHDCLDLDITEVHPAYLLDLDKRYRVQKFALDYITSLDLYYTKSNHVAIAIVWLNDKPYSIVQETLFDLIEIINTREPIEISSEISVNYLESGHFYDSFEECQQAVKKEFAKYGLCKYRLYLVSRNDNQTEYYIGLDIYPTSCVVGDIYNRDPIHMSRIDEMFNQIQYKINELYSRKEIYNVNL